MKNLTSIIIATSLALVMSILVFWLIGAYLTWDFWYVEEMGSWGTAGRASYAYGLFLSWVVFSLIFSFNLTER